MNIDRDVQMRVQNRFFKKKYYHVKVDCLILWTELWPFLEGTFGSDVEVRRAKPLQILKMVSPSAPLICSCTKNLTTNN